MGLYIQMPIMQYVNFAPTEIFSAVSHERWLPDCSFSGAVPQDPPFHSPSSAPAIGQCVLGLRKNSRGGYQHPLPTPLQLTYISYLLGIIRYNAATQERAQNGALVYEVTVRSTTSIIPRPHLYFYTLMHCISCNTVSPGNT